jgi:hypothetical protein
MDTGSGGFHAAGNLGDGLFDPRVGDCLAPPVAATEHKLEVTWTAIKAKR